MQRTTDTVEIGVQYEYHENLRQMWRKHERMLDGSLGEMKVTEHQIYLLPDTNQLKSAPYRSGPKTLEIIQAEVKKKLYSGVYKEV